jgi:hypothetical protein
MIFHGVSGFRQLTASNVLDQRLLRRVRLGLLQGVTTSCSLIYS